MFQVSDKVAIVFGAVGGIGKCTVKELLDSNIKGVVLADLNTNGYKEYLKYIETNYGAKKATFIKVDVTKLNEIKSAYDLAIQTFGNIDIVINCAGIPNENCYALNISVNLIGAIHIINEAYNHLPKHKSPTSAQAVIVNVASVAGLSPLLQFPAYSAAKAGAIAYSYCRAKTQETLLAAEAPGVKMLTLCPAGTETPMLNYGRAMCKDAKGALKEHLAHVFDEKRTQRPESVAKCILQIIRIGKNASCWVSKNDADAQLIDYDAIMALASDMYRD